MTRIVPGEQSSHRHAHSRQDEFIYVLEGEVTLETNSGQQILSAAMCAGFPAGTGDGHRFINHSSADTVLLVVGDRTANDEVTYPDIDMRLEPLPDGTRRFTRKDGTPYLPMLRAAANCGRYPILGVYADRLEAYRGPADRPERTTEPRRRPHTSGAFM
jgi:uncharacterized cupin superfamily protein